MSAHKDHHRVKITVDGAPAIVVLFRRGWQAWVFDRLLGAAVAGERA